MRVALGTIQLLISIGFGFALLSFGPVQFLPAAFIWGLGAVLTFVPVVQRIGTYLMLTGASIGTIWVVWLLYAFRGDAVTLKIGLVYMVIAILADVTALKVSTLALSPSRRTVS